MKKLVPFVVACVVAVSVAQADWVTSHIRLYKALGGGWQAEAAPAGGPG